MLMRFEMLMATATFVSCLCGCGASQPPEPGTAPGPAMTSPTAAPPPTQSVTPDASEPPAMPTDGAASNHFLGADVVLASTGPYVRRILGARVGVVTSPPSDAERLATVWDFSRKRPFETRHYWKTRAAAPADLVPGVLVATVNKKGRDGSYGSPASATEAHESLWWISRLVDARSLADGHVLLAAGTRAAPAGLRLLDGDDSPRPGKQGIEDKHFLADEHWFVGAGPLPDKRFNFVHPAFAAKPGEPLSGGEGRFVRTTDGEIVLTAHVWRTRIAERKDLVKGRVVFAPHLKDGAVRRAPKTRVEALSTMWLATKITEAKGAGPGTVATAAGFDLNADAIRVLRE